MRIGMIGTGKMGAPIAVRLLDAGHEVTVWDRKPEAMRDLSDRGATIADSPADTMHSDLTLVTLFDEEAVRAVLIDGGALEGAPAGALVVGMSTVGIDFAREIARVMTDRNLAYATATMLGRPEAIGAGYLNLFIAGSPATLDAIEAPLADAGTVWRVGDDPVDGNVVKLAANAMVFDAVQSMAEVAATVGGLGADRARFLTIMTETLFSGPLHKNYGPVVAEGRSEIASGLSIPLKDNAAFIAAARLAGSRTPFAEAVRDTLAEADRRGLASEDIGVALASVSTGAST